MSNYESYLAAAEQRSGDGDPLCRTDYEKLQRLRAPSLDLLREFERDERVSDLKEIEDLKGMGYTCEIGGSHLIAAFVGPVHTDDSADVKVWHSLRWPIASVEEAGKPLFDHRHIIPASIEDGKAYQVDLFEFIRQWVHDRKPGKDPVSNRLNPGWNPSQ